MKRYVVTVTEHNENVWAVYLRDTRMERWITLNQSASPEPAFLLSADEAPLLAVAKDSRLLTEAFTALVAVATALGECANAALRIELDQHTTTKDSQ